jgi:hypothetical protein
VIASQRLAASDDCIDEPGLPEGVDLLGEPRREGGSVGHHVDDPVGSGDPGSGHRRADHRVKGSPNHRQPLQPLGSLEDLVVGARLLLHGQHLCLQGGVPKLHHVTIGGRVEVATALDRHHDVITTGAQPQSGGRGVEQDHRTLGHWPGEYGVRNGRLAPPLHLHEQLLKAGPGRLHADHRSGPQSDHAVHRSGP